MPPPSNQRAHVEPPEQVTTEAVKGFAVGALRFGSMSILAHMILIMPHPFTFNNAAPPASEAGRAASSRFSSAGIRNNLFYRPLSSLSESIGPLSRVYRGLTPQFKTFLQIAAMTLGGSIWAERRVNEYLNALRRLRRAERRAEQ
ncbi:hypothetical protein UA08_07966 [Talaromyces atroroseus]|uniref:Uncharacterized protein n=1 Tax=Talaromyces atroroseus TaxID=1441469 RepID=A0A225A801_TALAT|nr:hypothetical protein UA08_07966 [Talaromyces atroroseus]OKL56821.1 hypothetical protein UA08_07966 [Talaromyces atroroseus]